jgi:ketosteroid isomerase-like protein
MPWFPDFIGAAELARRQARIEAAQADPVRQYFAALEQGDARLLESLWPGEVVVFDPRGGEIRGQEQLRSFVSGNRSWLAERGTWIEAVAATTVDGRAVMEMLAHMDGERAELAWPVAVVAESPDESSVVFRTYCSQWPVAGRREIRPPILPGGADRPGDVVGRHHAALEAGDVDAVVDTFAGDGYYREPIGSTNDHRGTTELRSYFATQLAGGGVGLECCEVTDDGVRCALEYNCVRWGGQELTPQAGLGVYERGPDGRLAAVRVYDDVEPPLVRT